MKPQEPRGGRGQESFCSALCQNCKYYGIEVPCAPFEGSAMKHSAGIYRSGVSRPWDAQPHIFMARGLAAFSRMFVQFFISALLAPSMQGHRLSVSPASSLSSFCPSMSKSYFPKSAPGGLLAFGFALRELALRRRRNRNVPWRPNPRRLINDVVDEVYRLLYRIIHFLVEFPVVVV